MQNVKKLLMFILVLSIFFISCYGCSTKEIEIASIPVKKEALNIPNPEALKLTNIEWIVITSENSDEVFKKLKDYNYVLFGITDKGYENLSNNFLLIQNYILEQKTIIESYKKYYEPLKNEKE